MQSEVLLKKIVIFWLKCYNVNNYNLISNIRKKYSTGKLANFPIFL